MNRLESTLVDVVTRLKQLDVDCALVGGLAVSVRAEPRFTRDVDLAVVASDALQLITDRGFERGRDLANSLEIAVSRWQT